MIETDKKDTNIGELRSVDLSEKEVPKLEELSPDCAGPVGGSVSDAFEINRIFYEGPPELLAELDRVLEAKEERDELVHEMLKVADEWGRQKVSHIKGAVNNKVRTFISLENDLIQGARYMCREGKKKVKSLTKEAMKTLQERLNKELKSLDDCAKEDVEKIRSHHRNLYARSEAEMKNRTDEVLAKVAEFSEAIQELTLEQLQELKQSGVLRVTSCDIAIPGGEGEDVRHQESD
jgi:ElaB/YqjD/DUF883 family membrane-anchored ribosome-binding protein